MSVATASPGDDWPDILSHGTREQVMRAYHQKIDGWRPLPVQRDSPYAVRVQRGNELAYQSLTLTIYPFRTPRERRAARYFAIRDSDEYLRRKNE